MLIKKKIIINYNYWTSHNVNYRINLKCFFLYKNEIYKKQLKRFKKEIHDLKVWNKQYTRFSLFNYYEYQIKQSFIYLSILNKNSGFIRYKGYQYFYPFWHKIMISASFIKIKRNLFNTSITFSNYIDGSYIKRYIFIFSPLLSYIVNQRENKLLLQNNNLYKQKFLQKKTKYPYRYFIYNKNFNNFKLLKFLKINEILLYRKYKYNKHINKKYKFSTNYYIWWYGYHYYYYFKRWKKWYRRFPFDALKVRYETWGRIFDDAFWF